MLVTRCGVAAERSGAHTRGSGAHSPFKLDVDTFLLPLPVGRLPGVGKVTGEKLEKLAIKTVGDLRALDRSSLEQQFGRFGLRLYELARGVDPSEVVPDRPTKSISAEDTFEHD